MKFIENLVKKEIEKQLQTILSEDANKYDIAAKDISRRDLTNKIVGNIMEKFDIDEFLTKENDYVYNSLGKYKTLTGSIKDLIFNRVIDLYMDDFMSIADIKIMEYINSEKFIDDIIDRIKRKQLK